MTWFSQVRHVLGRDLRAVRWPALVFVGSVVFMTFAALSARPANVSSVFLPTLATFAALSVMVMAMFEDSTAEPDAFWSVLPLRGSAVAAAKLVLLGLLCAVEILPSHLVRMAWSLPPDDLPLAGSVAMMRTAQRLAPFVLIAAASRNARAFLINAPLVAVGYTAIFILFPFKQPTFTGSVAAWVPTVVCLLGALVIVGRYWRPRADRVGTFTTLGASLVLLVLSGLTGNQPKPPTTQADLAGTRIALVADSQPVCERDEGRMVVPIEVVAAPGKRVDLLAPTLTVTTTTGARVVSQAPNWKQVMGIWGLLLPLRPNGTAWTILGGASAPRRTEIAFPLSATELASACGAVAQMTMDLDVHVSEAREMVRLPLRSGAADTLPGLRARIARMRASKAAVELTANVEVWVRDRAWWPMPGQETYALVDDTSGEAIAPNEKIGVPSWAALTSLPGLVYSSTGDLRLTFRLRGGATAMPDWASRATLLVSSPVTRAPMRIQREVTLGTIVHR